MPTIAPPPADRPRNAPSALSGLRVLDFSRMLAGPYSTQELADLGAEVIKVETPVAGDDSRHYMTSGAGGECAFYLSTNRNKKSIELDLKNAAGRNVAVALAAKSDIVVENFSNGVMERFGLGYETLSRDNPRLIYCSISGYGRDDGSAVPRRGYDAMFQAASGFMSMTGEAARSPMRTTVPVIDIASAMTATSAILAALVARERLGVGQFVEVALIDVAVSLLSMYGMSYLVDGQAIGRNGNRSPQTAPSDVYQTADEPLFITCGNDNLFRRMTAQAMGRADLADNPDYASNALRVRHEPALTRTLQAIFATAACDAWLARLSAAGVPCAPVNNLEQAFASADVVRRQLVGTIPHPTAGTVPVLRSPIRMSVTPPVHPLAPPLLGQHTDELVRELLGWQVQDIEAARSAGAFGKPAAELA